MALFIINDKHPSPDNVHIYVLVFVDVLIYHNNMCLFSRVVKQNQHTTIKYLLFQLKPLVVFQNPTACFVIPYRFRMQGIIKRAVQ